MTGAISQSDFGWTYQFIHESYFSVDEEIDYYDDSDFYQDLFTNNEINASLTRNLKQPKDTYPDETKTHWHQPYFDLQKNGKIHKKMYYNFLHDFKSFFKS